MKTVSIISHKGGAGKTSSAVMLAEDIAGRGIRVVLVDADRQRGAGLILGIDQPSDQLQQTRNIRLKYFCASGMPLRDIPRKAEEFGPQFDVAVVDTPSLDDPLAKGWLQLSTHILLVVPVEPLSIRTMESADTALENIRQTNPEVEVIGILPAMFDERDATGRQLMMELRSLRADELISPPIPHDPGLAHRAEQKTERRTEPSAETKAAYASVGDTIVKALGLESRAGGGAAGAWSQPRSPGAGAGAAATRSPTPAPGPQPAVAAAGEKKPGPAIPVAAIVIAIVVVVGLVVAFVLMRKAPAATGRNTSPGAAPSAVGTAAG